MSSINEDNSLFGLQEENRLKNTELHWRTVLEATKNQIIQGAYEQIKKTIKESVAGEINELLKEIKDLSSKLENYETQNNEEIGKIGLFPFNFNEEAQWLKCDGRKLSRKDYPKLFEKIQYTYGGNGDEIFHLPNVNRRYIRCTTTSENVGMLLEDTIKFHKHSFLESNIDEASSATNVEDLNGSQFDAIEATSVSEPGFGGIQQGIGINLQNFNNLKVKITEDPVGPFISIGSNIEGAEETRPKSIIFVCCIKAY